MLKIYGSKLCKDCIQCCAELDAANIAYEYYDICQDLHCMKEFLKLRDTQTVFEDARSNGYIGIPCIVKPDETVTLSWEEYLM